MTAILIFFAWCYVLWILFIAVMGFKSAWKTLSVATKILAAPWAAIAYLLDIGLNIIATILFADLPREATLSQRFTRYKTDTSWRSPIAHWLCSNLLDPFELGGHCK